MMYKTDKQAETFVEATHDEGYKKSYRRRKYEEEDDKGSVQDCFNCGFAYFSRWETDKPFSIRKKIPSPEDLVCFSCVTQRIFDRNIKALKTQQH